MTTLLPGLLALLLVPVLAPAANPARPGTGSRTPTPRRSGR